GDLVVARTPCAELAAQLRTGPFDQPALQRAVDIFVRLGGHVGTGTNVVVELAQGSQHALEFGVVQQSRLVQHLGVGARTGDVVVRQAPVKVRRLAQRGQRVGRPAGKTPAPEGAFVGVPA